MNNFKTSPGGLRGRDEYIGGRPKSDGDYKPKKKGFDKKGGFGGKGGFKKDFKGGDRGGSRGGFGGNRGGDRGGFGGSRDGGRREVTMHKATCSNCGKSCEVPFRPDGSKPVLCSECFGMTKTDARNGSDSRVRYGSDRSFEKLARTNEDYTVLLKQIAVLEEKLDAVIALVQDSVIVADEMAEEVADVAEKPKKAVAKKAPVKKVAVKKVAKKAAPKKAVAKKVTKKVKK